MFGRLMGNPKKASVVSRTKENYSSENREAQKDLELEEVRIKLAILRYENYKWLHSAPDYPRTKKSIGD